MSTVSDMQRSEVRLKRITSQNDANNFNSATDSAKLRQAAHSLSMNRMKDLVEPPHRMTILVSDILKSASRLKKITSQNHAASTVAANRASFHAPSIAYMEPMTSGLTKGSSSKGGAKTIEALIQENTSEDTMSRASTLFRTDPLQAMALLRTLMCWDLSFVDLKMEEKYLSDHSPFITPALSKFAAVVMALLFSFFVIWTIQTKYAIHITVIFGLAALLSTGFFIPYTMTGRFLATTAIYTNTLIAMGVTCVVCRVVLITESGIFSFLGFSLLAFGVLRGRFYALMVIMCFDFVFYNLWRPLATENADPVAIIWFDFLSLCLIAISGCSAYYFELTGRSSHLLYKQCMHEQERTQRILDTIFPAHVTAKVKERAGRNTIIAHAESSVTVLFCDLQQFQEMLTFLKPTELVNTLNEVYSAIDMLCDQHFVQKMETVSKTYMACGGLPGTYRNHAVAVVELAFDIIRVIKEAGLQMHLGVNTGPVIAGVVGLLRPQYSLFGDTVNTASRHASTAPAPNVIHLSQSTHALICSLFRCSPHQTEMKGKGLVRSYVAEERIADMEVKGESECLSDDGGRKRDGSAVSWKSGDSSFSAFSESTHVMVRAHAASGPESNAISDGGSPAEVVHGRTERAQSKFSDDVLLPFSDSLGWANLVPVASLVTSPSGTDNLAQSGFLSPLVSDTTVLRDPATKSSSSSPLFGTLDSELQANGDPISSAGVSVFVSKRTGTSRRRVSMANRPEIQKRRVTGAAVIPEECAAEFVKQSSERVISVGAVSGGVRRPIQHTRSIAATSDPLVEVDQTRVTSRSVTEPHDRGGAFVIEPSSIKNVSVAQHSKRSLSLASGVDRLAKTLRRTSFKKLPPLLSAAALTNPASVASNSIVVTVTSEKEVKTAVILSKEPSVRRLSQSRSMSKKTPGSGPKSILKNNTAGNSSTPHVRHSRHISHMDMENAIIPVSHAGSANPLHPSSAMSGGLISLSTTNHVSVSGSGAPNRFGGAMLSEDETERSRQTTNAALLSLYAAEQDDEYCDEFDDDDASEDDDDSFMDDGAYDDHELDADPSCMGTDTNGSADLTVRLSPRTLTTSTSAIEMTPRVVRRGGPIDFSPSPRPSIRPDGHGDVHNRRKASIDLQFDLAAILRNGGQPTPSSKPRPRRAVSSMQGGDDRVPSETSSGTRGGTSISVRFSGESMPEGFDHAQASRQIHPVETADVVLHIPPTPGPRASPAPGSRASTSMRRLTSRDRTGRCTAANPHIGGLVPGTASLSKRGGAVGLTAAGGGIVRQTTFTKAGLAAGLAGLAPTSGASLSLKKLSQTERNEPVINDWDLCFYVRDEDRVHADFEVTWVQGARFPCWVALAFELLSIFFDLIRNVDVQLLTLSLSVRLTLATAFGVLLLCSYMDSFTDFASFHVRRALHRGQIALLCCTVLVNYTVPLVALGTLSTSDNAPTAVHLLFLTLFANSGLRHQFLAPASVVLLLAWLAAVLATLPSRVTTLDLLQSVAWMLLGTGLNVVNAYLRELYLRRGYLYHKRVLIEQLKADAMLYHMLPRRVAQQIRSGRKHRGIADEYPTITMLYSDIKGFTQYSASSTPENVVQLLSTIFTEFDKLTEQFNVYKLQTIGDAYVCVSGFPFLRPGSISLHAFNCIQMGFSMLAAIRNVRTVENTTVNMRVGIHTGRVIAGVVGTQKLRYDMWGIDCYIANSCESNGVPGTLLISQSTADLVLEQYPLDSLKRGPDLKVSGRVVTTPTYFLVPTGLAIELPVYVPNAAAAGH